jgi:uncharacterized membrane protein
VRYPPYGPAGPRVERFAQHDSTWVWFGHLLGVLVFVALAALIVMLLWRWLGPKLVATPASASSDDDAALAHLRMRYARGDVSREDYVRIASDLGAVVASEPSTGT